MRPTAAPLPGRRLMCVAAVRWRVRSARSALAATCLAFTIGGLTAGIAAPAVSAGRSDGARDARGERPERLQEMRRQMLEYQRQWRGNAALDARPVAPLQGPVPGTLGNPRRERLPSGRLSDDERDQLRRQLRQWTRPESPRGE